MTQSTALVTAEQCPPGLWKTPQELAAVADVQLNLDAPITAQQAQQANSILTQAEQTQLHVRVIALENLVIALLASATEHQLSCAREMAAYILPRPGYTPHRLTIHAAARMISLIDGAGHLREMSALWQSDDGMQVDPKKAEDHS